MRALWLVVILIIVISVPGTSHAFGFAKYMWDGIANQFGLDRGPIMKAVPKCRPVFNRSYQRRISRHVYFPPIHIPADGF